MEHPGCWEGGNQLVHDSSLHQINYLPIYRTVPYLYCTARILTIEIQLRQALIHVRDRGMIASLGRV